MPISVIQTQFPSAHMRVGFWSQVKPILQQRKREDLKFHWNGLKRKKKPADVNGHPLTGSSEHYVLYDRFHENNTKDSRDKLRKIQLVPELAGRVNSQCAEQLFSQMRKNNCSLNVMKPTNHVFLMRNLLHHYNVAINNRFADQLTKHVGCTQVVLDMHGQALSGKHVLA